MNLGYELVQSIAQIVDLLFTLYIYILIARILITWVNPDPYNPIVRFLSNVADPLLTRARRVLPLQFSGFDLSPIVVILLLDFIRRIVLNLLAQLI